MPSGEPKLGTATKTGLHGQFYPYRAVSLSVCTKIVGHFYTGILSSLYLMSLKHNTIQACMYVI